MPRKNSITAVAYYRTSSAGNVGADKDSEKRQRAAVQAYAKAHGDDIIKKYYNAAVSGSDPIDQRDGFRAMGRVSDVYCGLATLPDKIGVTAGVSTGMRIMSLSFRRRRQHGMEHGKVHI